MISISNHPSDAADTLSWIDDVCRRLSDATGWPVRFVPGPAGDRGESRGELAYDPAADCWSMEIPDGDEAAGWLTMDLPADARRDRAYLSVCEMASLTGGLIGELLAARRALKRRTSDVSTLVDIGRTLASDDKPLGTLGRLLQAAIDLTGFRAAAFFLLAPSVQSLNLRGAAGMDRDQIPRPHRELEPDVPDLAALAGGRLLVRNEQGSNGRRWLPDEAGIGLAVAVQSEAGPLGTLWVYDRRRRLPGERETVVVESIAAQLAAVLERVVLLRESDVQHRMQQDLKSASESQPAGSSAIHPISRSGLDIASLCTSRYELGGDLCEIIPLDEHRTVVAVGDASGDSVPAAMVMSAVRGSLRTLAGGPLEEALDTAALMRRINRALYQITPPHQFMSLIYGVLDTSASTLTYTNAGHPVPVWINAGRPLSLESHGLLLGVDDDTDYKHSTIRLEPGDLLALYSDGISETRDTDRRLFGSAGVMQALRDSDGRSSDDLLKEIWDQVDAHAERMENADDRTLLVIRLR